MRLRGYHPYDYYSRIPSLKATLDHMASGFDDGISYAGLAFFLFIFVFALKNDVVRLVIG